MVALEWFRSFIAIYQLGTVSAAAEKLGLTQPAVSQHLGALERSFNTSLFQRTPRHMQPTDAARALYTHVVGAIEQLERVSPNMLWSAPTHSLKLRVGVPREFFYVEGINFLAMGIIAHQVEIVLGQSKELLDRLDGGELDAVVSTQRLSLRTLHYQPLMTETFILVGAATLHVPPQSDEQTMMHWLEKQAWVVYSAELPIIRRYWQETFGRHPKVTPRLIIPDLLIVLKAVTLGLGISVLPEYLCRTALAENQLRTLWQPPHTPSNQLYLVCQRAQRESPEFRWLAEQFLTTSS